jgi:hypothetical protein
VRTEGRGIEERWLGVVAQRRLAAGGEVEWWGRYSGGRKGRGSGRLASGQGGDARNGANRGRGELEIRVPR